MKEFENSNETFFKVGKDIPYKVPEGYFDELPTRIQDLCLSKQEIKEPVFSFAQVLKTQLALASGFIVLVMLALAGYYYLQPTTPVEVLSHSDYIEIVRIDVSEFDEALINSAMSDSSPFDTIKQERLDEMIKYLLEENVDYVTLLEQY